MSWYPQYLYYFYFVSCYGHKRQTPFIGVLTAGRICAKCVQFVNKLRGWLYGDFHPGTKCRIVLPSWKKLKKLQLYEKTRVKNTSTQVET